MIDVSQFVSTLTHAGVDFFCGVPDSLLKNFCAYVTDCSSEKVGGESRSPHSRDFLTVGSMGHASMIALGIAQAQPNRTVVCLDGDGASIMQMGNMAIVGQSKCHNLIHIVLNNSAHDSVGGQPTVGGAIDLPAIAAACGYEVVSGSEKLELEKGIFHSPTPTPNSNSHPHFLEIKVAKGARADLGRPKEPPQVNKSLFMQTLGVNA